MAITLSNKLCCVVNTRYECKDCKEKYCEECGVDSWSRLAIPRGYKTILRCRICTGNTIAGIDLVGQSKK
jgi:hypothetical protein